MNYQDRYQQWMGSAVLDAQTKKELEQIADNITEIEDRFYQELNFGTGGLRGVIAAGSNRMNKYTIRKATQGLVNYLKKNQSEASTKGVAIAYDSRNYSDIFAMESALVLTANGIKAYLFESLRPTPELSYAVRFLGCAGGIVITASHNPAEYNGYKVYGTDGGQANLEMANGIISEIRAISIFTDVKTMDQQEAIDKNLLIYIGPDVDNSYLSQVTNLSLRKDLTKEIPDFKIVYTPLHGTGLMPITKALSMLGYKNVHLVESQTEPDGNFPTVQSPNPEEKTAFLEAIKLAEEVTADIILGTDPDCDRVGVVVGDDDGNYEPLTGNQIGALLSHYLFSSTEGIDENKAVIKTIVTSDLGGRIAQSFGATVFNTLTGFKFIGEKIKEFEETGSHQFLFGYEESYGYLAGTFVRDKDAVIASILIVEMAAYYKTKNMSLLDALEQLYRQYGYYCDDLESFTFKGIEGQAKINQVVEKFRGYSRLTEIFPDINLIEDYKTQKRTFLDSGIEENIQLPIADVIKIYFKDQSWLAVRPSGTEPKLKIYYSTVGETFGVANKRLGELKNLAADFIK